MDDFISIKLFHPNGKLKFEGDMSSKTYKLNGQGILFFEDGITPKYQGGWKDNLPHGYGSFFYSNGTLKFRGSIKMGQANGTGTFYSITGEKSYFGEWKNWKPIGKGMYFTKDGKGQTCDIVKGNFEPSAPEMNGGK